MRTLFCCSCPKALRCCDCLAFFYLVYYDAVLGCFRPMVVLVCGLEATPGRTVSYDATLCPGRPGKTWQVSAHPAAFTYVPLCFTRTFRGTCKLDAKLEFQQNRQFSKFAPSHRPIDRPNVVFSSRESLVIFPHLYLFDFAGIGRSLDRIGLAV